MRQLIVDSDSLSDLTRDVLTKNGTINFTARGSSMLPFIKDRDNIFINSISKHQLQIGDVIFYKLEEDSPTAHRVVEIKHHDNQMIMGTRGDSLTCPAERVPFDCTLGKVIRIQRRGKIINLNKNKNRIMGKLWVKLYPIPNLAVRTGIDLIPKMFRLLLCAQSYKPFRTIMHSLFRKKITYQLAEKEDIYKLARFFNNPGLTQPDILGKLLPDERIRVDERDYIIIAKMGENIAGSVSLVRFPDDELLYPDWWMFSFYVRQRYRGMGIGEGLARTGINYAHNFSARRVNLLVQPNNKAAVCLYQKMGFREFSIPLLDKKLEKESILTGRSPIIMSLRLSKTQE